MMYSTEARELVSRALDWPALADRLWVLAPPGERRAAVDLAAVAPSWIGEPHARLARLLAGEPDHLEDAVRSALPWIGRDEAAPLVARWLAETAMTITFRIPRRVDESAVRAVIASQLSNGGLRLLDDRLHALPLLPFAGSVAQIQPSGVLEVSVAALTGTTGTYERRESGGVIVLDAQVLATTWAHEVAHASDPFVDDGALCTERFADHLSAALLEHHPTSLAEASPFIRAARAHAGYPVPVSIDDLAADVATFVAAPLSASLLARGAEAPAIRAHAPGEGLPARARAARVNERWSSVEGRPPASPLDPDHEGAP